MSTNIADGEQSSPQTSSSYDSSTLARPAVDEACICVRAGGRQILIDRGIDPDTGDRGESESTGGGEEEGEVDPDGREVEPAKRGRISGLSEDARRRLRQTVHAVDRNEDLLFVGLTWHEVMPSPDEAKRALDRFSKKLKRALPPAAFIWKLEPQERGVPHFHLFLYGCGWIDPQAISRLWHECTDEVSEQHRKSGVDFEWVNGGQNEKLAAYLAKYFSKNNDYAFGTEDEPWDWPGRFWGVRYGSDMPWADWAGWRVQIHPSEAARLISELLDEWNVDGIPDGVIPPSLMICTRGDPLERLDALVDRLD
jgi:hypothetical protein